MSSGATRDWLQTQSSQSYMLVTRDTKGLTRARPPLVPYPYSFFSQMSHIINSAKSFRFFISFHPIMMTMEVSQPWEEERFEVEIYENERAWIGGGFSKKGLLPNDWNRYSSTDGSIGWKTIEEASDAMLGKGWKWSEKGSFSQATVVEGILEGWNYARDFSSGAIQNAKSKRNVALHWVRFRRLVRKKMLDPDQFLLPETYTLCSHCDSVAKSQLSQQLLEILTFSCGRVEAATSSNLHFSYKVAIPIKAKMIELMKLGKKDDEYHTSSREENTKASDILDQLYQKLKDFANAESRSHNAALFCHSNRNRFDDRRHDGVFHEHCVAMSSKVFSPAERDFLAGLIIRDYDPQFQLHCNQPNCGSNCIFCPVPCANDGCSVQISSVHVAKHDQDCGFKVIPCPRSSECGELVRRNQMETHLRDKCVLREVTCPFSTIGCTSGIMLAKDLENHLVEHTSPHLLLSMNRMMEHQSVIKKLNERVIKLEDENMNLATVMEARKEAYDNQIRKLSKEINGLSKKIQNMEKTSKTEIKKIRDRLE